MDVSLLIQKIQKSSISYPHILFEEKGKTVSFINPLQYYLARKHWNIYSNLDYIFVDGISVVKILKLLYGITVPRLSFDMTTMARDFFDWVSNTEKNVYFIGSKQEDLEIAIQRFRALYPSMKIAGFRNGYFKNDNDRKKAIKDILSIQPSFVIVGMGSVVQEQFVFDLKKAQYSGVAITCGGFFHQSAKKIDYYPKWVNKYNLRALWRLLTEKGVYKKWSNAPIVFSKFIIDYYDTKRNLKSKIYGN